MAGRRPSQFKSEAAKPPICNKCGATKKVTDCLIKNCPLQAPLRCLTRSAHLVYTVSGQFLMRQSVTFLVAPHLLQIGGLAASLLNWLGLRPAIYLPLRR